MTINKEKLTGLIYSGVAGFPSTWEVLYLVIYNLLTILAFLVYATVTNNLNCSFIASKLGFGEVMIISKQ